MTHIIDTEERRLDMFLINLMGEDEWILQSERFTKFKKDLNWLLRDREIKAVQELSNTMGAMGYIEAKVFCEAKKQELQALQTKEENK